MSTIEDIRRELEEAGRGSASPGILNVKTANDWVETARTRPDPKTWFHGMIVADENTVLFASSNVGKSILAVQIAEDIARSERVMYLDLEMSDKQFQMRYTNGESVHRFPNNFLRAEINPDRLLDEDFEEGIIASIEASARDGVKVFIIDNITFVCISAERSESAGEFMKRIIALKSKYHLTILAIGHTPKRYSNTPLTQYDLAGSAKLVNLFDAAIALGCSVKDKYKRYIKQVKVRSGELIYDEDNVIVCELSTEDGWLQLKFIGEESEHEHLRRRDDSDNDQLLEQVADLVQRGYSVRKVKEELGLSHGMAQRMVTKVKNKLDSGNDQGVPSVPPVPHDTSGTPGTLDLDDIGDLPE